MDVNYISSSAEEYHDISKTNSHQHETGHTIRNNTAAWVSQARGNVKKKKPRDSSSEDSYCISISSNTTDEYPTLESSVPYRQTKTYKHNVDYKKNPVQPQSITYLEDIQHSVITRDPRKDILNSLCSGQLVANPLCQREEVVLENTTVIRNKQCRNSSPIASPMCVSGPAYLIPNLYNYQSPPSYLPYTLPCVSISSHTPYITPHTYQIPLSQTNASSPHVFMPSYNMPPAQQPANSLPLHLSSYNNAAPPKIASSFQPAPQVIPTCSNETMCLVPPSKHNKNSYLPPENHVAKSFITEIKLSYDSAMEVSDVKAIEETSHANEESIGTISLPQHKIKKTNRMFPNKDETKSLESKIVEAESKDESKTSIKPNIPLDTQSQSKEQISCTIDSKIVNVPKSAERRKIKDFNLFYVAPGYRINHDEMKSEGSEVSNTDNIKSRRNSVNKSEQIETSSHKSLQNPENSKIVPKENSILNFKHSDGNKNNKKKIRDVKLAKTEGYSESSSSGNCKDKKRKSVEKAKKQNNMETEKQQEKTVEFENKEDCVNNNGIQVKTRDQSVEKSKILQTLETEHPPETQSESLTSPSHVVLENNLVKARCVFKEKPPFKNPNNKKVIKQNEQNNMHKIRQVHTEIGNSNHKNKHTEQTIQSYNFSHSIVQENGQDTVTENQLSQEKRRRALNIHKFPCNNKYHHSNNSYQNNDTPDQDSSNLPHYNYSHVQDSMQNPHSIKKEKTVVTRKLLEMDKQYEHSHSSNSRNNKEESTISQEIKIKENIPKTPPTHSYRLARSNRKVRGNCGNLVTPPEFEQKSIQTEPPPRFQSKSRNAEFAINSVKPDEQMLESKFKSPGDIKSSMVFNLEIGQDINSSAENPTSVYEKIPSRSKNEGECALPSDFLDPACGVLYQFKNPEKHNVSELPPKLTKLRDRNETTSDSPISCFVETIKIDSHTKVDLHTESTKGSQIEESSLALNFQHKQAYMSDNQNNLEFMQKNKCRPPGFNLPPSNLMIKDHSDGSVILSKEGMLLGFEHKSSKSNEELNIAKQFEQEIVKARLTCVPSTKIDIQNVKLNEQKGKECVPSYNLQVSANYLAINESLSPVIQNQVESPPGFKKVESQGLSPTSQFPHDIESNKKRNESDSSSMSSDLPQTYKKQHESIITSEIQRRVHLASMKKEERIKYLFNLAPSDKSQSSDACSSEYEEVVDYWDGTVTKERKPYNKSKPPTSLFGEPSCLYEEITGNLFHSPPTSSLVHCVAEDMLMSQGIAIEFRRKFHCLGELLNQYCKSGELAILTEANRFIYYLVTKNFSYSKPLMCNLEKSVLNLKEHCMRHNVTHLCMPLIGCGRDQLSWPEVRKFLKETFSGTGIKLSVYKIEKVWEDESATNYMTHHDVLNKSLVDMDIGTARVFIVYDTLYPDTVMNELNLKFKFLNHFKANTTLSKGEVYRYESKYPKEILYGVIVRDKSGRIDFQALETAFKSLSKMLYNDKYKYLAVEALYEENDPIVMEKILTIMKWTIGRNCKNAVTLSLCYPTPILMLRDNYAAT